MTFCGYCGKKLRWWHKVGVPNLPTDTLKGQRFCGSLCMYAYVDEQQTDTLEEGDHSSFLYDKTCQVCQEPVDTKGISGWNGCGNCSSAYHNRCLGELPFVRQLFVIKIMYCACGGKLSRGGFSATFFVQCLVAAGCVLAT